MSLEQREPPHYHHTALTKKIWSTVPAEVPLGLGHRYMLRESIRKRALLAQQIVYYLEMGDDSRKAGLIKIGVTRNLSVRLWQLVDRYGGSEPVVLATEPGDGLLETRRHQEFGHLSAGGFNEYFRPAPELLDYIQQVREAWGPPMITGGLPADWPWPLEEPDPREGDEPQ